MNSAVAERIFEYDNYRFFLRDYFMHQKKQRSVFSHRFFARRAGFASSSFCAHVIDGKRNLTDKSLDKMIRGLGLSGRSAAYFDALVKFNQAKSIEDRQQCLHKMERIRKGTQFYKVNEKQFAYFDQWYYPVIRELAVYSDWNGDFQRLASLVAPSITPEKARKAVEILTDLGILIHKDDGTYAQSSSLVTVEQLPSVVTRKTRRELIHRAIEAMEALPLDERQITGCTVAMSEKDYREVVAQLEDIRKRILEIAADSETVDRIYQLNFQTFPLSSRINFKRKKATEGGAV